MHVYCIYNYCVRVCLLYACIRLTIVNELMTMYVFSATELSVDINHLSSSMAIFIIKTPEATKVPPPPNGYRQTVTAKYVCVCVRGIVRPLVQVLQKG